MSLFNRSPYTELIVWMRTIWQLEITASDEEQEGLV